jgi:hypothetical protein
MIEELNNLLTFEFERFIDIKSHLPLIQLITRLTPIHLYSYLKLSNNYR